jgi:hypothetical protein
MRASEAIDVTSREDSANGEPWCAIDGIAPFCFASRRRTDVVARP